MHVLLADDHPVVLAGLADFVQKSLACQITTAQSTPELELQLQKTRPQIVITDLMMPGGSSIQVVKEYLRTEPSTKVIVFSGQYNDHAIRSCLEIGVSGMLHKLDEPRIFLECLKSVVKDGSYYSDAIKNRILESNFGSRAQVLRLRTLSDREMEVLHCIGSGFSNQSIANELGISIKTVNRHKSNIMSKLAIKTSSELMHYAIREGIVDLSQAPIRTVGV